MSHAFFWPGLLALAVTAGEVSTSRAQKRTEPTRTHPFELKVRPAREASWEVFKFGFEGYKDPKTGAGLYVSQEGYLTVAPGFGKLKGAIKEVQAPTWGAGLLLTTRKEAADEFNDRTIE